MWYLLPIIKIKDVYTHALYCVMIVARLLASIFIILSAMRSDIHLGADIGGQNDKITQWGKPPMWYGLSVLKCFSGTSSPSRFVLGL